MPKVTQTVQQIIGVISKLNVTISIKREHGGRHWFRRKRYKDIPPDVQYTAAIEVKQTDGRLWTVTVEGCLGDFISKCQEAYEKQLVTTFTITNDE